MLLHGARPMLCRSTRRLGRSWGQCTQSSVTKLIRGVYSPRVTSVPLRVYTQALRGGGSSTTTRFKKVFQSLNAWQKRHTFIGCIAVSVLKASAADAIVQNVEMRKNRQLDTIYTPNGEGAIAAAGTTFDFRRHAAFIAFGLLYGGAFQYLIFNRFLPYVQNRMLIVRCCVIVWILHDEVTCIDMLRGSKRVLVNENK